ncbi:ABC transporter permease [Lacticaseibacillus hulanensis]|uniref:ABC transporter permease n=1 Tax=Lacticaseibacillus hulanensis TaxID=2493111 RepID=UPI000FD884D7|nr:ABC transporter permease [Lacticaseibacillus hulanensis]
MNKFWVVTKQVYKKNVRSGSWLFLVVSPILLAAIIIGVGFIMGNSAENAKLAVVTTQPAVTRTIGKAADVKAKTYTKAAADKALREEKVDGVLTFAAEKSALSAHLTTRVGGQTIDTAGITAVLNQMSMQSAAQQLQLSSAQLRQLTAPAKLKESAVAFKDGKRVNKDSSTDAVNRGIAMGITILMMLFMMVYGSILAQEIATEKGSRIMEMLLSSVSATTQFFGKLAGILLLLFTQIAVYVVAGGAAWPMLQKQAIVKMMLANFDFSALASVNGAQIILFFLIGTLSYAVLAALTGSLVANQEQVQQAVMPLTVLGLLGYFGALTAQAGDSAIIRIGSYIPFLSASIMPVRSTMGFATSMQGWIALGISTVFLGLFTWFTVRVYKANVLVYKEGGLGKALRSTLTFMRAQS